MAFNILLKSQLQRLVNKLFAQIFTYGTCSTARNVVAKEVSLSGFVLKQGSHINVRFTDTSTSNPSSGNISLNVNSTGAKEIKISSTNAICDYTAAELFCNNIVQSFVYDGSNWIIQANTSGLDALITKSEFENLL